MVALALAVTLALVLEVALSPGCGGSSSRGLLVVSVVSHQVCEGTRGVDCCWIGAGDSGSWW